MIKLRRLILAGLLFFTGLAHADWASDRAGSAGYVTVTTLASVIDEAVPFCVVYLSDMPAGFWTAMDAASDTDGKTIRVSTSDGSTQLPCVPLGVNTSTDTGCLIFLDTGSSASVDVAFRIYNGNASLTMPSASGGMGEQAVFADYVEAWILNSLTGRKAGTVLTATGSPTAGVSTGYEGITGYDFNGTTQYLSRTSSIRTALPVTIEASGSADVNNALMMMASTSYSGGAGEQMCVYMDGTSSGDKVYGIFRGDGGSYSSPVTSTGFSISTWTYCATTRDAHTGTAKVYINGANSGSDSTTLTAYTGYSNRTALGARITTSVDFPFNGQIAWALFSAVERSANYMSTQHQNWLGNLYSVGTWTSNSIAPGTTGWVLFQTAATTTASGTLVDWTSTSNALVDDSTFTTAALDNGGNYESEYLNLTNPAYGVTVPTGAPSYTVEFRIKRARDSGGGHRIDDLTVQFIDDTSTRVGSNLALTANWPTTAATQDYTLAGYTPDGTEFTSAAGLAIRATAINAAGLSNAQVLVAWIKVSWTGTDTLAKARGFFALTE